MHIDFSSVDGKLDNEPVKASDRNGRRIVMIAFLALLCDCFQLPYYISKLILGEERDTSIVFGLGQMLCCRQFVAFLFQGHGRVWQVCPRHKNTRAEMAIVGRCFLVHGSEKAGGR